LSDVADFIIELKFGDVNIGLRRQLWQLDYFTEGSIPDALIGVPQGWTPDQIKQFQDYWDAEFAGDLAKRRRAKFVPGETAAKVVQTKEPQHKDDFDEWLARIICFAFLVPPQWATKAMNRAIPLPNPPPLAGEGRVGARRRPRRRGSSRPRSGSRI
jgi:hypothetical protein